MSETPKPAKPTDLLTISQVAAVLHMSESSIRSYIRQGILPAQRIAGKRLMRIRRSDAEAILYRIEASGDGSMHAGVVSTDAATDVA